MKCGYCGGTLKHGRSSGGMLRTYGRLYKGIRYHHKCFSKLVKQGKISVKDLP